MGGKLEWFEVRHLVTFSETNVVGNVYFAHHFLWQGKSREALLAKYYPEFAEDVEQGFGLITDYANMDFLHEARVFDVVNLKIKAVGLTPSRIEFEFEFVREQDNLVLSRGKQAVVWVNQKQRAALMPEKLYTSVIECFGIEAGA